MHIYSLIFLSKFFIISCNEHVITQEILDDFSDNNSQQYINECSDRWEPLIEQLASMQNPASGHIVIPKSIRDPLASIYKRCASITDELINKTFSYFEDTEKAKECIKNAEEFRRALSDIKNKINEFATISLNTDEGKTTAYGYTTLNLPLSLLQGRATLNFQVYCQQNWLFGRQ